MVSRELGDQLIEQLAGDLTQQIWPGIRQSQSVADAGLLPSLARRKDSLGTVWRTFNSYFYQGRQARGIDPNRDVDCHSMHRL
jgi:hypothetical protein